ncbi:HD domain-containing protein [Spirillospora sp. NPDC049024]
MVTRMSLIRWAYDLAEECLAQDNPRRWAHCQGAARQARKLRDVAGPDADLLEAAAILHDIGYATPLARLGFHPLDGAHYLRKAKAPARLVNLVAHHSFAALEARLRGIQDEFVGFEDEGPTAVRDGLWLCDLTTMPDGAETTPEERRAEIEQRYGRQSLVGRFVAEAAHEQGAAIARTKSRLRNAVSA